MNQHSLASCQHLKNASNIPIRIAKKAKSSRIMARIKTTSANESRSWLNVYAVGGVIFIAYQGNLASERVDVIRNGQRLAQPGYG